MNEYSLKIGDVLWTMRGHKKHREEETQWHAVPVCIEHADDCKFLDAYRCGGSWSSIGKNYFLTREECLRHWEEHRQDYEKPAATSAMFHECVRMGSIIGDSKFFWRDEDVFRVFIHNGLSSAIPVEPGSLPWKMSDEPGEYGQFDEYITLGDIREKLGKDKVITVWYEGPLYGEIFETGNYPNETAWRLHGQTQGYA